MEQLCLALLCHRVNVAVWSSLCSILLCWIFPLCPFSSSLFPIFWSEPEPCNSWVELLGWSEIEVVQCKFTYAELVLLLAHHKVVCASLLLWSACTGLSLLPPVCEAQDCLSQPSRQDADIFQQHHCTLISIALILSPAKTDMIYWSICNCYRISAYSWI